MTQEHEPTAPSPDQLISQADAYLKEAARRRSDLREIKRLVGEGRISDEILERITWDFGQFQAKPTFDLNLQKGIELRRKRQEQAHSIEIKPPTEEETKLPKLTINPETQLIEIDGRIVGLPEREFNVLRVVAQNVEQKMSSRHLSVEALNNPNPHRAHLREIFRRLRVKINTPEEEFLIIEGRTKAASYMLRGVEVVWSEEPKKHKKLKEFPPPLHDTRVSALLVFLIDPTTSVKEISRELGPSRQGRELLPHQIYWTLLSSANKLWGRVKRGFASQDEAPLWDELKKFTGQQEPKEVLETFKQRLEAWFKRDKEVMPTQVEEIEKAEEKITEPFSIDEATVTALFLENRSNIRAKYGLPDFPEGLTQRLIAKYRPRMRLTTSQINEYRINAFRKFKEIVQGQGLEKIFDRQEDSDIQELILYFIDIDTREAFDFIEEVIRTPEASFQQDMETIRQRLVAIDLQQMTPNVKTAAVSPEPPKKTEEVIIPQIEETTHRPITPAAFEGEQPTLKLRERTIEKRDPEIRQKINSYLDQIVELKITRPVTGDQLTRFFPTIKLTHMESSIEKGYIRPGKNRDRHEVFSKEEITILLYVRHNGNNLTGRMIKELTQIVREEIAKREKENGNSSGK